MEPLMTANPEICQRIDPYDPDLPLLASQAAIELDCISRRQETTLNAAYQLAQRLRNSFEGHSSTLGVSPDRPTASLVGRAISPDVTIGVDDLVSKACEIANDLGQAREGRLSEREAILRARDFCVALARCATVFRRSMQLGRRAHPFRK